MHKNMPVYVLRCFCIKKIMLIVFLNIIVSLILAYLVTEDASYATIHLGATTLYNVPLFWIVFSSMIVGMFLSSATTIKNLIETKLTIFGKNDDLKKAYKKADALQSKVDKLEEESQKSHSDMKA